MGPHAVERPGSSRRSRVLKRLTLPLRPPGRLVPVQRRSFRKRPEAERRVSRDHRLAHFFEQRLGCHVLGSVVGEDPVCWGKSCEDSLVSNYGAHPWVSFDLGCSSEDHAQLTPMSIARLVQIVQRLEDLACDPKDGPLINILFFPMIVLPVPVIVGICEIVEVWAQELKHQAQMFPVWSLVVKGLKEALEMTIDLEISEGLVCFYLPMDVAES
jgi:hypothetical protein